MRARREMWLCCGPGRWLPCEYLGAGGDGLARVRVPGSARVVSVPERWLSDAPTDEPDEEES